MLNAVPTRRELFAWIVALAVTLAMIVGLGSDVAEGAYVPPAPTTSVVVATGTNYPDALGAGPTAALGLAPILLVQQDAVPTATLAELNRLQPEEVILVGGTAVISDGVKATVEGLSFAPNVVRVAGANRYETAAAISAMVFPTSGLYSRAAHAQSSNLPDGDGTNQDLLSVDIVAPAPGVLLIDAGVDLWGGPDTSMQCWLKVGLGGVTGSSRHPELLDTSISDEDCTTEAGVDVPVGTHTITFAANPASGVYAGEGSLTVLWVPFDGYGVAPSFP